MWNNRTGVLALTVGVVALLIAAALFGGTRFGRGDPVFGTSDAVVFQEEYSGPPAVGEFLSALPNLAPLPKGNRTHEVRLDVVVQDVEVADGVRYRAWTFGGSVPGPVLHVREGDRIVFTMKNRTNEAVSVSEPARGGGTPFLSQLAAANPQKPVATTEAMPHSMDFHSGTVAADDKWRTIVPGQSIRFEWVANYPGVYLYHCGTPPVLQHMSMGQYGAVVVSPRNGYPTDGEVDREYVVIQSEFYLKPGADTSGLHELDWEAAQNRRPTIVAFNGHRTSLVQRPLVAEPGERVRFYLLNVGPNGTSSFHVIGGVLDRVWYEGSPENEMRGMQTVLLGASNGAVVEMVVPEEGEYVLVDHEMADAFLGAVGHLVTSGGRPTRDARH